MYKEYVSTHLVIVKQEVDMTLLEREDPIQERLLEHVSQYTVPSQSQIIDIDNKNTIESSDMNMSSCPKQGNDAWNDYGHIYSQLCKMVDKNGKKGREAFMRGLNLIRKEQTDLLGP